MTKQSEGKYFGNPWEKIKEATRYNGGWTKSVTGIDRSKNNGYSLKGDFMGKSGDTYIVGNLYLDCGIGGSRKNQEKFYNLFTIESDGKVKVIAEAEDSREWAISLWNMIEEFLGKEKPSPLAKFSTEELLAEIARRK